MPGLHLKKPPELEEEEGQEDEELKGGHVALRLLEAPGIEAQGHHHRAHKEGEEEGGEEEGEEGAAVQIHPPARHHALPGSPEEVGP